MAVGVSQQRGGEEGTPEFVVYSDGACRGNPGPGGAAFCMTDRSGRWLCRSYGFKYTTSPRTELMAVVLALELVPEGTSVIVCTDNERLARDVPNLSLFAANGWKRRTRKKGWKRLFHRDLWQKLHHLVTKRTVTFEHVRGHAGIPGNEAADTLARYAAWWASRSAIVQSSRSDSPPILCMDRTATLLTAVFVPVDGVGSAPVFPPPTDEELEREALIRYRTARGLKIRNGLGYANALSRARTRRRVDIHEGSHWDFHARYVKQAVKSAGEIMSGDPSEETREFFRNMFLFASDFKMLKAAYQISESKGSVAAGVDNRSHQDYSRREKTELLTELSWQLREGRYKPQRLRRVWIPKPNGRGRRPVDIAIVPDRTVETAMHLALTPILDPLMHEYSVGFRPGRSLQEGLAKAIWLASNRGLWTFTTLDLKQAFTRIPKQRLVNATNKYVPNAQLAATIRLIIQRRLPRGKGILKGRGLPQGSPLSPLMLNLYLSHHLDWKWALQHPETPVIRYADDLLLLTQTPEQAVRMVELLWQQLRPHGMSFRDERPVIADLQDGQELGIWGYRLQYKGNALRLQIPDGTWEERVNDLRRYSRQEITRRLDKGEEVRHTLQDDEIITDTIRGWLDHAGPTYPGRGPEYRLERSSFIKGLRAALVEAGIDPVLPPDELHRIWRASFDHWTHLQEKVAEKMVTAHAARARAATASPVANLTEGGTRAIRQVTAAGKQHAG